MSLPIVSGEECISALAKLGYVVARIRGSHARLTCPGRIPVTVPLHRELDRNTLRTIIKAVRITSDEFKALLEQ